MLNLLVVLSVSNFSFFYAALEKLVPHQGQKKGPEVSHLKLRWGKRGDCYSEPSGSLLCIKLAELVIPISSLSHLVRSVGGKD